ncbi:uncharacterized mitochondrial protein AtMg00810-like [Nicotiana sylvestris]|uniref:uncharacterized mitochondrial protein AtMg00810-like n=1 Tax=Nicotiana sylvestris TaxID=4096 RepID=UPI00388CDC3C
MKLTEVLLQMGFKQSHYDYTLFIREANGDTVIILMYVDDLLITGNNDKSLHDTRTQLQKKFKMKDLGELKNFLGIEFSRSKEGILMYQRKYALELMSETGLGGAKPSGTPLELNKKLTYVECDKCNQITNQEVQVLIQYMHCPKVSHMEAALRVVRYIKQAPIQGLLMPAERADKLIAYCDSDWASCIESMRPVTGYLVKFGNALVSWKSKKQMTVSRSSAEVEFKRLLKTQYVHTQDQLADLLTKSLGKFQHDQLLNQLEVKNRSVSLKCGFPLRVFFLKLDLQIYDN